MIKHLKIIDFAISSLLRRKFKSAAILIAYTLTVATLASVLFLTHSLRTETTYILEGVPDLIVQRTMAGRHELIPLSYIDEISTILGVSSVTPRYWGYYYDALTGANYTLIGAGSPTGNLDMLTGRLPKLPGEVAVGAGVDLLRGVKKSGELILINSRNIGVLYELTGSFQSDSSLLTNDLVVLTDEDVVDFFDFPVESATDLAITVPQASEIQTVAAKIKQRYPDTRPITRSELIRTYDMVFNWRSGMMLTVICAAVIAFCIMAWDKATGISADEKQEIGILKAVGWDTGDVLALKFWEGLLISLTGFLSGILIAYLHVFIFDGFVLAAVLKGWSVLFPPFQLVPAINLFHLLVMGFFTVVPYVACTVVPTWKTAITDPDSIMRG